MTSEENFLLEKRKYLLGLRAWNSTVRQRCWSGKIETPVTSLSESRCHNAVVSRLNCLTVILVGFDKNSSTGKQFTISFCIAVRLILDCMNSVVITELNTVLNVSFQGGKEEIIFCCQFHLCFVIWISL